MPANTNALQTAPAPAQIQQSDLSSALSAIFRGRFCQTLLQNRNSQKFEKGETLYDISRKEGQFFFIRSGVVKIGTITETGEEVIFDIRKAGEVVGELSASSSPRIDRAVALELTEAVPVSYEEILATIQKKPAAPARLDSAILRFPSQRSGTSDVPCVSRHHAKAHKNPSGLGRPAWASRWKANRNYRLFDSGRAGPDGGSPPRKRFSGTWSLAP